MLNSGVKGGGGGQSLSGTAVAGSAAGMGAVPSMSGTAVGSAGSAAGAGGGRSMTGASITTSLLSAEAKGGIPGRMEMAQELLGSGRLTENQMSRVLGDYYRSSISGERSAASAYLSQNNAAAASANAHFNAVRSA